MGSLRQRRQLPAKFLLTATAFPPCDVDMVETGSEYHAGANLSSMDLTLALTGDGKEEEGQQVDGSDAAPFAQLYQAHLTALYRYFVAHTGNESDAADLTQQVFVQALAAWPRYSGSVDTARPWLFRIARNALIDRYRRRHPSLSWDDLPAGFEPPAVEETEATALRRDEVRNVRAALAGLPSDKRELLVLRFAAGLTVREIAAALDRKDEAVRSEIRRLLQLLKERMADE